ncbi:SRPBCC family protein [Mucilaginibacter sp. PAMB04168]|uniref:SRPBCC family protein n=1 Tax=Mucilaginibacter sp. PAMB04168 TaxID=3138567 RepID=UPI0031F6FD30
MMTDKANEIVSTRVFNFSREQLFKAWAQPEYLAKWWGPKGFTNIFKEFDFTIGGNWMFTMHAPDGNSYENLNRFTQIVVPELIVYDHLQSNHAFTGSFVFEELPGKTKVIFTMAFESAEECQKLKAFITPANEENFDRLQAVLEVMPQDE